MASTPIALPARSASKCQPCRDRRNILPPPAPCHTRIMPAFKAKQQSCLFLRVTSASSTPLVHTYVLPARSNARLPSAGRSSWNSDGWMMELLAGMDFSLLLRQTQFIKYYSWSTGVLVTPTRFVHSMCLQQIVEVYQRTMTGLPQSQILTPLKLQISRFFCMR